MDTLVIGTAQLLPFAFPLVAAVVWLGLDRRGKLDLDSPFGLILGLAFSHLFCIVSRTRLTLL